MRRRQVTLAVSVIIGIAVLYLIIDSDDTPRSTPTEVSSGIEPARFEISFLRGTLRVAGHVVSPEHEQQLLRAASESFSGAATSTRFVALADAPEMWESTTRALVEALAAARSATATLTPGKLTIRGIGTGDWGERFARLRAIVPEYVMIDSDVVIPKPDISTADLCAQAIASHQTSPVYFEESATTFRSSAYAVLERTMSLASACRDSTISITGHTDSSGYEPSNSQLSLSRARIVADYFAAHGISRDRLLVRGVGSSLPVADNDTRFGRSLNRRITIEVQHAN